jgi:hypothetical protein
MSGLERRVGALEAAADRARLRRLEGLAHERGVTLDALLAHYARLRAERERLKAGGMTDDRIIALTAQRMNLSVEELRRRADELISRLS